MAAGEISMNFLPRDERFYECFDQQIAMIREAARLLDEILTGTGQNHHAARIAELEKSADDVLHRFEDKINKSFLTPVDPEDLHSLGNGLDEILDLIDAAAFRIETYQLPEIPESGRKLGALIEQCTEKLAEAFAGLKNSGFGKRSESITKACAALNNLEQESENTARHAIRELFSSEKDPIRLIKLKELHECLETINDRMEYACDTLSNVMVKNS